MAIKAANPKVGPTRANESTPLMVGGTLYTSTSLSQVAAIDAATGETKWVFDPKVYENGLGIPANDGWLHRGVAYWRNGDDERIVMLTAFAQMIALDAKTGKPVPTFGTDGRVDLAEGLRRPVDRDYYTMSSPPVIVRGVIVVGSSVMDWWGKRPSPPGDVRGFDVRDGQAALDLPHRSAGGRARRRNLGERFLEGGRQRQCLGADERRRGTRLLSICRSQRRPTTITAAIAPATASMATASSASMRRPAGRSGTISSCITGCGTTTRRPRPI